VKNGDNPEKALAQGFANEVEKAGSGAENVTNYIHSQFPQTNSSQSTTPSS
ncbi:hypothetical protein TNCT_665361, partial [Trichonephila clavata]